MPNSHLGALPLEVGTPALPGHAFVQKPPAHAFHAWQIITSSRHVRHKTSSSAVTATTTSIIRFWHRAGAGAWWVLQVIIVIVIVIVIVVIIIFIQVDDLRLAAWLGGWLQHTIHHACSIKG
jgi:hypothetical protein